MTIMINIKTIDIANLNQYVLEKVFEKYYIAICNPVVGYLSSTFVIECYKKASHRVFLTAASTSGKYHAKDETKHATWLIVKDKNGLGGAAYNSAVSALCKKVLEGNNSVISRVDHEVVVHSDMPVITDDQKVILLDLGGNAKHVWKVLHMTDEAIRRYGMENNKVVATASIIGALCHDMAKFVGNDGWWHTTSDHPRLGAELMEEVMEEMGIRSELKTQGTTGLVILGMLEEAIASVANHYGIWGKPSVSPFVPSVVSQIVQEADYYASRRFLAFPGITYNFDSVYVTRSQEDE